MLTLRFVFNSSGIADNPGLKNLGLWCFAFVFLFIASPAFANNLAFSSPSLMSKDRPVAGMWDIQFNVSWSDSWCDANAACMGDTQQVSANWDAAWVFVKFTKWLPATSSWDVWKHCTISTIGHTAPEGSQITAPADGKGIFIYRNVEGRGNNSWSGVKMRWKYESDGVVRSDIVKVKIFGVEMVYIPAGGFKAGDYATSTASFQAGLADKAPWSITSEDAIHVTAAVSNGYYYVSNANFDSGETTTGSVFIIPMAFPKGYGAFYIMKYELSQGMYRDFLNTLTRPQQTTRTASIAAGQYAMSGFGVVTYRSGIRVPVNPSVGTIPIAFGCDLNANGVFNEDSDGEWVACNYLNWGDVAAFADWAGLRPFTELEFEKAARGPQPALAGEYVWGSTSFVNAVAIDANGGKKSERPLPFTANLLVSGGLSGPVRCGAFARSTGNLTRMATGASYYGVMDLSGNLWERPVTVGNVTGLAFTGLHGDGTLDSFGRADTMNWPLEINATGAGCRGGGWNNAAAHAHVSDRSDAAAFYTDRIGGSGARLARTSF